MWLGFQSTLGISAARAVYTLTNPASTFRYVFADLAVLLTYNFGYALMPVIVADQMSDGNAMSGINQKKTQTSFNDMLLQSCLLGLSGIFYGIIVLKVTGLGYFRGDTRTLLQKMAMYGTLTAGSSMGNNLIYFKSKDMSKVNCGTETKNKR